ncbi:cobyrinic acid a,c-diamide synthase [Singulisphaera sp. PoT]|uniref:cobyrinic acid a,c-diamide synthase n=1 Tax=Singulisphaera sp. PoT TaxID=3411797 RepID=UPI003BF541F2
MTERRCRVQHFRSRACPLATGSVGQVTGLPGRHLDAWLMPKDVCRKVFERGARQSDLAIVEGTLEEPSLVPDQVECDRPGELQPIVDALDLPVVAVVPYQPWGQLHLPCLPRQVEAILIDGIEDPNAYSAYRSIVSMLTRRPVIGAVEALPEIRTFLSENPWDQALPESMIQQLRASFLRFADFNTIQALARSRPFPGSTAEVEESRGTCRFRVAYAQDEAFGSYFPDTLETLEALGAELVEFSPLTDERLPHGIDLVMIGCGFPDKHADQLAENLSLISALRSHVCRGQRIYTEGGGTAYLCQSMLLDGRRVSGAGIFPYDAERLATPSAPTAVTSTLSHERWIGPKGTVVRGYNPGRWRLHPSLEPVDCPTHCGMLTTQGDITYHQQAIGSLIHLHLGSLPEVVSAFAVPHRCSYTLPYSRP